MPKINVGDKVRFYEKAKTERTGKEVTVSMEGSVRGFKVESTSNGTYKKYLVSDVFPQAYRTPSDYGWFVEKDLEQLTSTENSENNE